MYTGVQLNFDIRTISIVGASQREMAASTKLDLKLRVEQIV